MEDSTVLLLGFRIFVLQPSPPHPTVNKEFTQLQPGHTGLIRSLLCLEGMYWEENASVLDGVQFLDDEFCQDNENSY